MSCICHYPPWTACVFTVTAPTTWTLMQHCLQGVYNYMHAVECWTRFLHLPLSRTRTNNFFSLHSSVRRRQHALGTQWKSSHQCHEYHYASFFILKLTSQISNYISSQILLSCSDISLWPRLRGSSFIVSWIRDASHSRLCCFIKHSAKPKCVVSAQKRLKYCPEGWFLSVFSGNL